MNLLSAQELKSKIDDNENIQIIDVREDYEFDDANIGGINIPLDNMLESIEKINRDKQVVFCCRTGKRSKAIIHTLERKFNLDNLFSLEGGVEEYFKTT